MGACLSDRHDRDGGGPQAATGTTPSPKRKGGKRFKMLLLGAGESGKSTMAKQMKLCLMKGFGEDEVQGYKKIIQKNVLENMRTLIRGAEMLSIALDDVDLARRVVAPDYMTDDVLSPEAGADLKRLWTRDTGIRQAATHASELHLVESAAYYFDCLDRLSKADYRPTTEDILRSRRLTVGAEEMEFLFDGYAFHVIDVGGQKGEREKWIDYFQNNDAVIFFVALSEYDQKLYEDNVTQRLADSLKLFSDVCNHQWFSQSSIILFLNKSDVFRDKLTRTPLASVFPEYHGPKEFEPCAQFIQQKFLDRINNKRRVVYPFLTCAIDSTNFQKIFSQVKDIVVSRQAETPPTL